MTIWRKNDKTDMVKYIVVDELESGFGDCFETIHDTAEQANRFARGSWEPLTAREQQRRHIFAAVIREEDLAEYAKDEETGEIDWREWINCHTTPQLFDSRRLTNG